MDFYRFINILWSRKWIALSALMITVITTLVVSLLLPKQYLATTSIVIDQLSVDPVTGQTLPSQLLPAYMATQVDVITSHNVARKVVEELKLIENPKMRKEFAKAKTTADIRDWIADLLLEQLEIEPSRESSVMQVSYTSTDPKLAASVANAFADAYMKTSIELRTQPVKLSADWFDSQMGTLREHLERAQSRLSTYQQKYGIVATDDRLDLENARLAELSRQLVESQAHTSELQSRKDLLTSTIKQGGSSAALQEVISNPLIQSLKSELARAEASFAESAKRYGVNHPRYKQAEAEVKSLQQKIRSESKMVLSNIVSDVASSKLRDKIVADALAEQKAKVLKLKKQHDEMALFERELENAQRAYDDGMQRAIKVRMQSEMKETDVAILTAAIPPPKPTKPNVLLNMIVSVFLGGMLGVGAALLAELMDRRVRSAFDVSELLAVPVFTVASASNSKRMPRLS